MSYFIFCGKDRAGSEGLRAETKARHSAYLDAAPGDIGVLMSGPLCDDDGREWGSAIVFEAENSGRLEKFLAGEPYHRVGLFGETKIMRWNWKRGNPFI